MAEDKKRVERTAPLLGPTAMQRRFGTGAVSGAKPRDVGAGADPFENGYSHAAEIKVHRDRIVELEGEVSRLKRELAKRLLPVEAVSEQISDKGGRPPGYWAEQKRKARARAKGQTDDAG